MSYLMNKRVMNILKNINIKCICATTTSRSNTSSSSSSLVNLSYDLYDKHKTNKSIVIAHGLFAAKYSWRSVAKAINERTKYKVFVVDLRNHGDSMPYVDQMDYVWMANDLNYFIRNVVIKETNESSVAVLGHSMGGKAFMTCALLHPDVISKLIVGDVSPNTSPSTGVMHQILDKMMNHIDLSQFNDIYQARKFADQKLCEIEGLKQNAAQRSFILTRIVEKNAKPVWHFNLKAIHANINNIMEFPNLDGKTFDKLTMFLGGEKSDYITEKDKPDINKFFKNNLILKVSKAGHVIHLDNPSETIKYIDDYLNKMN